MKWGNEKFDDFCSKINIRLHNYPLVIALKNLKAAYIGNFAIQYECTGSKVDYILCKIQTDVALIMALSIHLTDRLVSVRGTVIKVSTVKPLVIEMSFACTKCGTNITRDFPDGKFSPPPICEMHGCKSRTFTPIRSSAQPVDFQKIRCDYF